MIKTVVVVAGVLFLIGCAPAIRFSKEYAETSFSDKNVVISLFDTLVYRYTGNMDNEFPAADRSERIRELITNDVLKAMRDSSVFMSGRVGNSFCDLYRSVKLPWSDSVGFNVLVPANECAAVTDSNTLWLFIEAPKIASQTVVQLVMVGLVPVAALPHKPLTISSKFVYWDAVRRKPVAWGYASGTYDNGSPAVTMDNWTRASRIHALSMIRKSPFARNYTQKK